MSLRQSFRERREIAGGIRPNFHIDAREMAKLIYQRINPIHKVWIISIMARRVLIPRRDARSERWRPDMLYRAP
jgi:hypothetical protein